MIASLQDMPALRQGKKGLKRLRLLRLGKLARLMRMSQVVRTLREPVIAVADKLGITIDAGVASRNFWNEMISATCAPARHTADASMSMLALALQERPK